jgi:hypothetical protein
VEDRIQILGAGSDHSAFAFYAGVPAVYLRFEPDKQIYKGLAHFLSILVHSACLCLVFFHSIFVSFKSLTNIRDLLEKKAVCKFSDEEKFKGMLNIS